MNEKTEKLEKKIREEIQRRVWEEEEFLISEGREDKTHVTQIKALGISTFLPREDVAEIAKAVRDEFERKHGFRKWIWIPAALCLAGGILFFVFNWVVNPFSESEKNGLRSIFSMEKPPDTTAPSVPHLSGAFEEPFDNGKNGWFIGEDFVYKGVIEDGHYVFEGGEDYQCYGDRISVKFPNDYAVELTSTWKSGNFDLYGFSLSQENGKGHVFPLKGDGTASYASLSDGMPEFNDPWHSDKANSGDGKVSNLQRIEMSKDTFRYFINGRLLKKGSSDGIRLTDIVIHCCGKQRVEFNHLKIITLDQTPKVIMNESFEKKTAGWSPETIFSKRCYFENGEYIFSTNKEEACNLSLISVDMKKDICIRLDSIWKRGENSPYGLLLMKDDDNYLFYQLQNNRGGRFIQVVDGDLKYDSDWKTIEAAENENKNIQSVTVTENKFRYDVNGVMFETWENPEPLKINKIGVEVCGKQTVAFDHLSVR